MAARRPRAWAVVVTAGVVAAVVPPSAVLGSPGLRGPARARRGPLPVARLGSPRLRSTVYGIATIDRSGRLADRAMIRVLGWVADTRLAMRECGGLVQVTADGRGVFRLTGQGHLRLPTAVRQWCGLAAGDRLLLAADPRDGLLVVYPPAVLDVMTGQFAAAVAGGDSR